MSYKIVVDSCCDLTPEKKQDPHFQIVPLTLEIDGRFFVDDETFVQKEYLDAVAASDTCARTACPSPQMYLEAYHGEEEMVFVVTLSEHLSGSYASAVLGRNLYMEENPDSPKRIHVFSSDTACCGEALVAMKIQEAAEAGASYEEIVEKVTDYIEHLRTYFVLEDMETLRKNGRLTGLAALVVTALNIRPVMSAKKGVIIKIGQSRGLSRALRSMVDHICKETVDPEHKRLGISFVNCPERAESVRKMLCERIHFGDVYVTDAAGVTTTYACDGGVVVAV